MTALGILIFAGMKWRHKIEVNQWRMLVHSDIHF